MSEQPEKKRQLGRRAFLQSLFGAHAQKQTASVNSNRGNISFFWCSLDNGQVAFPTGAHVPFGLPGAMSNLVAAAALLESGELSCESTRTCEGVFAIGAKQFRCSAAHGPLNVAQAIGCSCEVFFAQTAHQLSADALVEFARKFALDRGVAGFNSGCFPEPAQSDAAEYALGTAADLAPNALQLLRLAAAIATHGQPPPLHNAAEAPAIQDALTIEMAASTWQVLQEGMRLCAQSVSFQAGAHAPQPAAILSSTVAHKKAARFVAGYFPHEKPRYAFCAAASGTDNVAFLTKVRSFLFDAEWP